MVNDTFRIKPNPSEDASNKSDRVKPLAPPTDDRFRKSMDGRGSNKDQEELSSSVNKRDEKKPSLFDLSKSSKPKPQVSTSNLSTSNQLGSNERASFNESISSETIESNQQIVRPAAPQPQNTDSSFNEQVDEKAPPARGALGSNKPSPTSDDASYRSTSSEPNRTAKETARETERNQWDRKEETRYITLPQDLENSSKKRSEEKSTSDHPVEHEKTKNQQASRSSETDQAREKKKIKQLKSQKQDPLKHPQIVSPSHEGQKIKGMKGEGMALEAGLFEDPQAGLVGEESNVTFSDSFHGKIGGEIEGLEDGNAIHLGSQPDLSIPSAQSSITGKGEKLKIKLERVAGGENSAEENGLNPKLGNPSDKQKIGKIAGRSSESDSELGKGTVGNLPSGAVTAVQSTPFQTEIATENQEPIRSSTIQDIAAQIVDQIQIMKKGDETQTTITLRQPPVLEGATITLTSSDNAKREFNISFANLSPEAKVLLDNQLRENPLGDALKHKGITVHILTTSTEREQTLTADINETLRDRQEQQQEQQQRRDSDQQRQRQSKEQKFQDSDDEEGVS